MSARRALPVVIFLTSFSLGSHASLGDEPAMDLKLLSFTWRTPSDRPNPNVKGKTLGGKQFWSDIRIENDWRIQRHSLTNHCRLLDNKNVRRAWGTESYCQRQFDHHAEKQGLKSPRGKVAIVIHGLCRHRAVMKPVADKLKEAGFTPINVSYASTRLPIEDHARSLAKVVSHLDRAEEIYFVAHSMGNLVVRHYLGDLERAGKRDPRIKRFVMLGPPNHGAVLARRFKDNSLVKVVWGDSGDQLAEWDKLKKRLAVPACEFGIIAGGRGKNPLIPGSDDLFVSVSETRLTGARDFRIAKVFHSQMATEKVVQDYTVSFLKNGYFTKAEERQAINADQQGMNR